MGIAQSYENNDNRSEANDPYPAEDHDGLVPSYGFWFWFRIPDVPGFLLAVAIKLRVFADAKSMI